MYVLCSTQVKAINREIHFNLNLLNFMLPFCYSSRNIYMYVCKDRYLNYSLEGLFTPDFYEVHFIQLSSTRGNKKNLKIVTQVSAYITIK